MKKEGLTIVFWNVWFYTQNGRRDNGHKLTERLEALITEYKPAVFGLNEVLVRRSDNYSQVIDFLAGHGYSCHFAPISPTDDEWLVGNLLASKLKPQSITDHVLGPDTQAMRRGFPDCTVKAIKAEFVINKTAITVVVNYLCSLLPVDWGTHLVHRKHYEQLLASFNTKNLVVGGDFNETKYMLPWLKLPSHLKRKTGTALNPTWRLNGQKRYLAFANYDHVLYSHRGNLRLQTFQVLDRQPSDHAPMLAVFEVLSQNFT